MAPLGYQQGSVYTDFIATALAIAKKMGGIHDLGDWSLQLMLSLRAQCERAPRNGFQNLFYRIIKLEVSVSLSVSLSLSGRVNALCMNQNVALKYPLAHL